MEIKHLADTPLSQVMDCFHDSFSDYAVKMPTDLDYWQTRFRLARADFSLSFGVFDGDRLVAFIIQCVDHHEGQLAAYNTGTGVLPYYRGKGLVDAIYKAAFQPMREKGIEKCMLEVLKNNERAIRVYERIGFRKDRVLCCFKGKIEAEAPEVEVREISHEELFKAEGTAPDFYSWDFNRSAVEKSEGIYKSYLVSDSSGRLGWFTLNPENGTLARIEAMDGNYTAVLGGVAQISSEVKINNVDESRTALMEGLVDSGVKHVIDQFEMSVPVSDLFART